MGAGRLVATATMLVVAVAAVELTAATPGFAGALRKGAAKPTQLVLTVAKGQSTRPAQQRASLTCAPAGGS